MRKFAKTGISISMALALLLLAGINMKDDLFQNIETRRGISSIILSMFISLALVNTITFKQITLRGSVISREVNPKLYFAGVIILFVVALIFLLAGIINLL